VSAGEALAALRAKAEVIRAKVLRAQQQQRQEGSTVGRLGNRMVLIEIRKKRTRFRIILEDHILTR